MKEDKYFDIEKRTEIRETARKLRRQFLRYQEAELVYSMTHRKLLEIAGKAGAIYRIDNTVLINRDTSNFRKLFKTIWICMFPLLLFPSVCVATKI